MQQLTALWFPHSVFQGQKCSACSRAIVDKTIYNEFVKKLKAETEKLVSGDPAENFYCGPVINASAEASILGYIEKAKKDGNKLVTGGEKVKGLNGYFINRLFSKM